MSQPIAATTTDAEIREALQQADLLALRAVLYQFSGDESLRAMKITTAPRGMAEVAVLADPEDEAALRERALDLLCAIRDGRQAVPPPPGREELLRIMDLATCATIAGDRAGFYLEELAMEPMPRRLDWSDGPPPEVRKDFHVLVIGAGFGGLNAAIQLKDAGIPYTIVDKNPGVGGTWWQNTYPGFRVDVASRIYSYTFEAGYDWGHTFAPRAEIHAYIEHIARKYGVRDTIRFNTEVLSATWDDDTATWDVRVRTPFATVESIRANAIISGVGLLDRPVLPDIEGLDTFQGKMFHTARWDHSYDYRGKRIGVIGTGASAMQLVPDVAPDAGNLVIFQRSAGWVVPVPGYRDPVTPQTRWLYQHVPYYVNWFRLRMIYNGGDEMLLDAYDIDPEWPDDGSVNRKNHALRERLIEYLMSKVGDDPELAAKCIPNYPPMAKRIILDNGWFDALKRPNVELTTERIARITPKGVLMESGQEYEFDLLVVASGFRPNDFLWPMDIRGRGGVAINDLWAADGSRAYLGMMMPGFPNLWCLYGPNTNQKTGGPVMWGEMQTRYALSCMKELLAHGWKSVDVKREVYDEHQRRMDDVLAHSIWMHPSQRSYYRNDFGRVATNTAWGCTDYWKWTRQPDMDDFIVR
ncbi:MAG: NAD(P)/FAD-dependent oxidoreductase [Dehalococcoidia bacterium]|nr:NAD(P)/FAD-dependent oxidoreductase [Dehalococcoidia bacterium]